MSERDVKLKSMTDTFKKMVTNMDYSSEAEFAALRLQTSRIHSFLQTFSDQKIAVEKSFVFCLFATLANSPDKALSTESLNILTYLCLHNAILRRKFSKIYPNATNDLLKLICNEHKSGGDDDHFMLISVKLLSFVAPSDNKFTLKCRLSSISKIILDLLSANQASPSNLLPLLKIIKILSTDSVLCNKFHKLELVERVHSIFKSHNSKTLIFKLTLLIFSQLLKYKSHLEPFLQRRGAEDLLRFLCTSQKGTRISKVTFSTACVLNQVASIACGAEELQRLRVCDRLLHLLSTLKSRPHNHSFIYILFDIMLKSATYHQPSFITSSSSCYKYPLVEKFSKKPILEPVQLMSDGGVSEESVASAEDPVAKTTTSSPKRGQNFESMKGANETMECFFEEHFFMEDLIAQQTQSSHKITSNPKENENSSFQNAMVINDIQNIDFSAANQSLNNQTNNNNALATLDDVDFNMNDSFDFSNISNKYFKSKSSSQDGDSDDSENCRYVLPGDSNYEDDEDNVGSEDEDGSRRFIRDEEDGEEVDDGGCDVKIGEEKMSGMMDSKKGTDGMKFNNSETVSSTFEGLKKNKKDSKNKVKRKKNLKNKLNSSLTDKNQFETLSSPLISLLNANNETKTNFASPKMEDSKRGELKRHLKLKPILKQSVEKKNSLLKHLSQSPYLHQAVNSKVCKLDSSIESLLKNKLNNNTNADIKKEKNEFVQSFSFDDCFSSLSNLLDSDVNGGSTSSFVSGSTSGGSNPAERQEDCKDNRNGYQLINIDGEKVSIQSYNQVVLDQKKFIELASRTRPAIHFSCIPHPDLHGCTFPPFEKLIHEKTFLIVRKRLTEDVNRYFENSNLLNKVVYDLDFLIKQKLDLTKSIRNSVNTRHLATLSTKQNDTVSKTTSIKQFKPSPSEASLQMSNTTNDTDGVQSTRFEDQNNNTDTSKPMNSKTRGPSDTKTLKLLQTGCKEDEMTDLKSLKKSQLQNNDLSIIKRQSLLFEKCYKACNYLNFDSKFECGNLRKAIQVREREYDLILNADINTSSHQQWFYFKVTGMEALVDYRFNIVNCEKANSQFNYGMQPVMYSVKEAVEGRGSWCRVGKDVCYYKNHLPKPHTEVKGENVTFYHTCSFNINFLHSNDVCYIAYHYPYSYTKLMSYLHHVQTRVHDEADDGAALEKSKTTSSSDNIFNTPNYSNYSKFSLKNVNKNNFNKNNTFSSKKMKLSYSKRNFSSNNSQKTTTAPPSQDNQLYFNVQTLCQTLNGNDVPLLTITSFPKQLLHHGKLHSRGDFDNDSIQDTLSLQALQLLKTRPYIVLSARVHPGETNSSWMMQGTIDFLLSGHPTACRLREDFVFKVVPMLNPDGVINGNHRCSLTGDDLNRQWSDPSPYLHPTIYYTKLLLSFIKNNLNANIYTYCDFHGHSRKKNVFLYGCSPHQSWRRLDQDNPCVRPDGSFDHCYKMLPSLLGISSPSFHLPSCSFSVERSKEATARVVVWRQFGVIKSYTMESTYSGFDQGPYDGLQVNPYHLQEMGQHLLHAIFKARAMKYEETMEADENKSSQSLTSASFKLNSGGLSYEISNKTKKFQGRASALGGEVLRRVQSMDEFVPFICHVSSFVPSLTSLSKRQPCNEEDFGVLEDLEESKEDDFKDFMS